MARRPGPALPPEDAIALAMKRKLQFIAHTSGGRALHFAEQPEFAGREVLGRDLERRLVWVKLAAIDRVTILPAPLVVPPNHQR